MRMFCIIVPDRRLRSGHTQRLMVEFCRSFNKATGEGLQWRLAVPGKASYVQVTVMAAHALAPEMFASARQNLEVTAVFHVCSSSNQLFQYAGP